MMSWTRAITLALSTALAGLPSISRAADVRLRACLSPIETHDTLQAQKLIPPFRAMIEAARTGPGESLDIKLCRLNAAMVYDVTLLRHDGRLVHILVDASSGAVVAPGGAR